jgi:N-acetylglucosaminyldiphosphoundecaprenol N-acetyl-beta-D-mannosaminyltransferase
VQVTDVAERSQATRHVLLGCPIDALTLDQTVRRIVELMSNGGYHSQFSLNAAKVVDAHRDAHLRALLDRATIVNADGQSLVWAGKVLGVPLPERVAGIDLLTALLGAQEREGFSAYLLGAREGVVERTVDRLARRHPSLRIAGFHHGHFPPEDDRRVATLIAEAQPDALFVGMSSPRKEDWIDRYQQLTGARFAMGVGGSFDVIAGVTNRAPRALQRVGLEWAYRTAQEPRRLAGRYARTNGAFVWLVASELVRTQRRREKRSL